MVSAHETIPPSFIVTNFFKTHNMKRQTRCLWLGAQIHNLTWCGYSTFPVY